MLVEVLISEDGGLVPCTMGLLAPRAATVMAQVEQPEVQAVLELLVVDLDGRQFLLQPLHPHGGEGGHLWVTPHAVRGCLGCTCCPAGGSVDTSVHVWWGPVDVAMDLVEGELDIHVENCRWGRRRSDYISKAGGLVPEGDLGCLLFCFAE